MFWSNKAATCIKECGPPPCVSAKEKDDDLANATAHALQRITGNPADPAATERLDSEIPYNLAEQQNLSCWMRADAIEKSGMLRRFNRYREALPAAYAAEDTNTLGDAADDEDRQKKRKRQKCLTRLPDSAPELNIALRLPEGTIKDMDLRDDDTGFRAGLYRTKRTANLSWPPGIPSRIRLSTGKPTQITARALTRISTEPCVGLRKH
jgi:hypothetical protein